MYFYVHIMYSIHTYYVLSLARLWSVLPHTLVFSSQPSKRRLLLLVLLLSWLQQHPAAVSVPTFVSATNLDTSKITQNNNKLFVNGIKMNKAARMWCKRLLFLYIIVSSCWHSSLHVQFSFIPFKSKLIIQHFYTDGVLLE